MRTIARACSTASDVHWVQDGRYRGVPVLVGHRPRSSGRLGKSDQATDPNTDFLFRRGPDQADLDHSQYRELTGAPFVESHHTMSHYDQPLGGTPAEKIEWMEIYSHWTLNMYGDFLAKLDSYMDIDGESTVLDNTLAIFSGDNSDSSAHGYLSMPCLIGGRGGKSEGAWRINAGRQLRFGAGGTSERSWKDLLSGAMNILGVPDPNGSPRLESFGYATAALDDALGT